MTCDYHVTCTIPAVAEYLPSTSFFVDIKNEFGILPVSIYDNINVNKTVNKHNI